MGRQELHGVLPAAAAGAVLGLIPVVNTLAGAELIFSGTLAPGLLVGLSALLAGTAASLLLIALRTEDPGLVGGPLSSAPVIYALIPAALGLTGGGATDPIAAAHLVVLGVGLVTLVAGALFWLLGTARLAVLLRFLPYPVVSGYSAGIGWLFLVGGLALGGDRHLLGEGWLRLADDPTAAAHFGASLTLGLAFFVAIRRWRHWAIMPCGLLLAAAGFHLLRLAGGVSLAAASHAGWLLGPFGPKQAWQPPDWGLLAALPPSAAGRLFLLSLTVVLTAGTHALMSLAGIELELERSLDPNREMRAAGIGSAAAGLLGGLAAAPSLTLSSLAHRMGARSRMTGTIAGATVAAVLLLGTGFLDLIPRFAVAGVLVGNGIDGLIGRLWRDRTRLSGTEWAAELLVLAAIAGLGLLDGVALGLCMALAIFIWNYRRVTVVGLAASGVTHRSSVIRPPEEDAILRRDGDAIRLLRLHGYLFFLNIAAVLNALPPAGPRFLVLDFRAVSGMDSSGGLLLRRVGQIAAERGYAVLISGLSAAMEAQFDRLGLPRGFPPAPVPTPSEDAALRHAESAVLAAARPSPPPASLAGLLAGTFGSAPAAARLAPYFDRCELERGATLVRQGDPADALYLIAAGQVSVLRENPPARPLRVATAGAGVVMGEIGVYVGGTRTATVRAETPVLAWRLSRTALATMERTEPSLAGLFHRAMVRVLADKLTASTRMTAQRGA